MLEKRRSSLQVLAIPTQAVSTVVRDPSVQSRCGLTANLKLTQARATVLDEELRGTRPNTTMMHPVFAARCFRRPCAAGLHKRVDQDGLRLLPESCTAPPSLLERSALYTRNIKMGEDKYEADVQIEVVKSDPPSPPPPKASAWKERIQFVVFRASAVSTR